MFQDDEDDDILEASRSAKEVNPFSFQNFLADESEPTAEPTVEPAEQDAESNPFSFKTFVNDKKPSVVVSGASSDSDSSSIDSDEDLDQNGEQNGAPVAQRLSSKVLDGSMKKPPATVAGRIRAKVQQLETQLAASQEENQQLKSRYKTTLTKLKRDNKDLQQQLQEVRAKNNQLQKALDLKTTREQDETKQLEQVASQVEKNLAKAIARANEAELRVQQLQGELVEAKQQLSNVASEAVTHACMQLEQLSQEAESQLKAMLSQTGKLRNISSTFRQLGRLEDAT